MDNIELYKALAAFQADCPIIEKEQTGYGYKYANFTSIVKVVNPLLRKHSLGFFSRMEGSDLITVLFHSVSGQSIQSRLTMNVEEKLKGMNSFQVFGSAMTYYRRYALEALLGITSSDDKDANAPRDQKPASAVKPNIKTVPDDVIQKVSLKLEYCDDLEKLKDAKAECKDDIAKYPQVKTMFLSKFNKLKGA